MITPVDPVVSARLAALVVVVLGLSFLSSLLWILVTGLGWVAVPAVRSRPSKELWDGALEPCRMGIEQHSALCLFLFL